MNDVPAPSRRLGRTVPVRLVRLFPPEWRERFGDEFEALLAETPFSFHAVVDVLAAALDAHLNPDLPRRWPPMNQRLRSAELAVFASWVAFVVAGLGFQKLSEDDAFHRAASANLVIGGAFDLVVVAAVAALAAVLVAGIPLALAIVRTSLAERRWQTLALLAVPPVSLAAWLAVTFAILDFHPSESLPWRVPAFVVWVGVFFLAAIASTLAVSAAAIRSDVDVRLYRRAAWPAAATTVAMAVTLAALAAWGVGLLATDPELFWGDGGMLATTTAWSWIVLVAAMAVATTVAGINARTALGERGA